MDLFDLDDVHVQTYGDLPPLSPVDKEIVIFSSKEEDSLDAILFASNESLHQPEQFRQFGSKTAMQAVPLLFLKSGQTFELLDNTPLSLLPHYTFEDLKVAVSTHLNGTPDPQNIRLARSVGGALVALREEDLSSLRDSDREDLFVNGDKPESRAAFDALTTQGHRAALPTDATSKEFVAQAREIFNISGEMQIMEMAQAPHEEPLLDPHSPAAKNYLEKDSSRKEKIPSGVIDDEVLMQCFADCAIRNKWADSEQSVPRRYYRTMGWEWPTEVNKEREAYRCVRKKLENRRKKLASDNKEDKTGPKEAPRSRRARDEEHDDTPHGDDDDDDDDPYAKELRRLLDANTALAVFLAKIASENNGELPPQVVEEILKRHEKNPKKSKTESASSRVPVEDLSRAYRVAVNRGQKVDAGEIAALVRLQDGSFRLFHPDAVHNKSELDLVSWVALPRQTDVYNLSHENILIDGPGFDCTTKLICEQGMAEVYYGSHLAKGEELWTPDNKHTMGYALKDSSEKDGRIKVSAYVWMVGSAHGNQLTIADIAKK